MYLKTMGFKYAEYTINTTYQSQTYEANKKTVYEVYYISKFS